MFGLGAASFAWRGWVFAGVHGDIDATTLGGQTWGISFLVGVLFNIAMATSLPLLISRRNQREWLQSRELLGATEQLAQVASLVFESDTQRTSANRVLHHWLQVPQGKSLDLSVFLAAIETTARTELTAHIDQLLAGQGEQWTQECSLQCPDAKRLLIIHCGVRRGASGKRRRVAHIDRIIDADRLRDGRERGDLHIAPNALKLGIGPRPGDADGDQCCDDAEENIVRQKPYRDADGGRDRRPEGETPIECLYRIEPCGLVMLEARLDLVLVQAIEAGFIEVREVERFRYRRRLSFRR